MSGIEYFFCFPHLAQARSPFSRSRDEIYLLSMRIPFDCSPATWYTYSPEPSPLSMKGDHAAAFVPANEALYSAHPARAGLAPALFGSVLGILGLTVMMAGATPHVAHAPLSDLYHASGATPADQATLALMRQATWGIFWAKLYVGFFVVPIGVILLGAAMFVAPTFGKGFGVVSTGLGVAGLVAAILQMVDPASMIGAATYFACVILYLILRWKVYRLSRAR